MYLSHYHGDHYGNMTDIINNPKYTVKTVYVPALPDIFDEEEDVLHIPISNLTENQIDAINNFIENCVSKNKVDKNEGIN